MKTIKIGNIEIRINDLTIGAVGRFIYNDNHTLMVSIDIYKRPKWKTRMLMKLLGFKWYDLK